MPSSHTKSAVMTPNGERGWVTKKKFRCRGGACLRMSASTDPDPSQASQAATLERTRGESRRLSTRPQVEVDQTQGRTTRRGLRQPLVEDVPALVRLRVPVLIHHKSCDLSSTKRLRQRLIHLKQVGLNGQLKTGRDDGTEAATTEAEATPGERAGIGGGWARPCEYQTVASFGRSDSGSA